MTHEEKLASLIQNGITLEDLKDEWHRGFTAGFEQGTPGTFKTCYAAVVLALHELHGFGQERCYAVLRRMDELILDYFTSQEIIDDVYKKIGLEMNFKEGVDRIQYADDAHPWRTKP
jgi:hypothetical protein